MTGIGEVDKRHDGKWAFRVKAKNGEIVATDGGPGYEGKADAKSTLKKLMSGKYRGKIKELD